ncbi:DNA damage-regulated autophagy modulator protein 2-like [Oopsacas minuta]|uniref:DNA damage-regulated autophagy modulator protein 2-like n=1 Tax=Oopsacas minuta TaxID=111878 RepID=A0AAV7IX17_9METZ|nr:DNA damage-regulated autophagy modulator protein 2-like [Oopsacas minuta]
MYYIPAWTVILLLSGVFALGNLLTYTIGVSQDHFRPVFPYISDTGAYPIENGFFVLVFAITSLFALLTIYIRFKDVHIHTEGVCFKVCNYIFLVIGIMAIFFLLSVAAFEFDDSSLSNRLHFASAILTIFLNYVYSFGQAFIGLLLPPIRVWWKWLVFAIQLSITIFGIILFFYYFAASFFEANIFYLSVGRNVSSLGTNETLLALYYEGLAIDYSRAVVQWMIFVEVIVFFLTLIPDFHRIRVNLQITRPYDQGGVNTIDNEMKKV